MTELSPNSDPASDAKPDDKGLLDHVSQQSLILRKIRFANELRISGEAIKLTIAIARDGLPATTFSDEIVDSIRKRADKEIKSIDSRRKYHLDRILAADAQVTIYVYAREVQSGRKYWTLNESPGEKWITDVDVFQESLRKNVAAILRSEFEKSENISVTASWVPGSGVFTSGGVLEDADSGRRLEEDLWSFRIRLTQARHQWIWLISAILIIAIITTTVFIIWIRTAWLQSILDDPFLFILSFIYPLIFMLVFAIAASQVRSVIQRLTDDIRSISARIDLLEVSDVKQKHAYKLFQLSNDELRRYYEQARRQRGSIFFLGIICILAGFGAVAIAVQAIRASGPGLEEKIVIAILGGVGSILANFVAVIFIKMFSDIVASTVEFHMRLVGTHHALFGNLLAAKIEDTDLASKTLAKLAVAMVPNGTRASSGQEPDDGLPSNGGSAGRKATKKKN